MEKAFISYLNDDDKKIEGYFEILDSNGLILKFKSENNVITIPYSRILKIKEKIKKEVKNGG